MFRATILIDNNAHGECKAEWGFSVYIAYCGKNYLLDMGSSALFSVNAEQLGIDLSQVDAAVLSHAHCDHAGGSRTFFEKNCRAKLYMNANSGEDCFCKFGPFHKYVGIPRGVLA